IIFPIAGLRIVMRIIKKSWIVKYAHCVPGMSDDLIGTLKKDPSFIPLSFSIQGNIERIARYIFFVFHSNHCYGIYVGWPYCWCVRLWLNWWRVILFAERK